MRSIKDYALITLKGLAMGAADVIPGVSGGTIAFITGIYEEFINALKSFDLNGMKVLRQQGIKAFWQYANINFLIALFLGIGISVLSLAKLITWLLHTYPEYVWSFFFGLIIASVIVIARKITRWSAVEFLLFAAGTGIAWWITEVSPTETTEAPWFVFLSGMIAICAMILPGISGSFILLLMGKYAYILNAVHTLDIKALAIFAAGAVTGLLTFSHLLSWMFRKHHNATVAMLAGFMLGSLNKVWPWKITLETRINSHGEEVPFIQENVWPADAPGDSVLWIAVAIAIAGFAIVYVLESIGNKGSKV